MPSMCRPSPRLKADDSDVSAKTAVNHAVGSIAVWAVERRSGSERMWWECRADRLEGTRVSRKVFQRRLKGLYVKEKGGSERLSGVGCSEREWEARAQENERGLRQVTGGWW
jgi:hypothetical protein